MSNSMHWVSLLWEIVHDYTIHFRSPILWITIALGLIIGRFLGRNGHLEHLIQRFNETLIKENVVKEKLSSRKSLARSSGIFILIILISIPIICYYLRSKLFRSIQNLRKEPFSEMAILLYLLVISLMISIILRIFSKSSVEKLTVQLSDMKTNNSVFLDNFFGIVGEPMKKTIFKAIAKSYEQKKSELESTLQKQKISLQTSQEKIEVMGQKATFLKKVVKLITSFEWCENCLVNAKNSAESTSNSEFENNENATEKIKDALPCEFECLPRFLGVCETLARKMGSELVA